MAACRLNRIVSILFCLTAFLLAADAANVLPKNNAAAEKILARILDGGRGNISYLSTPGEIPSSIMRSIAEMAGQAVPNVLLAGRCENCFFADFRSGDIETAAVFFLDEKDQVKFSWHIPPEHAISLLIIDIIRGHPEVVIKTGTPVRSMIFF
jgi:hypothetical protein